MIGARELLIAWSDTPQYWLWKACADSRFSMVAELMNVCMLDIRVRIQTEMLSSNTTYGAYLVFKLAEECYGLESANAVVRFLNNEAVGDAEARSVVVHCNERMIVKDAKRKMVDIQCGEMMDGWGLKWEAFLKMTMMVERRR